MGSSTVKAQKLANEANIAMTRETNQTQIDIANSANEWNRKNLELQNQWNIDQWNRENEYNSPVQQVQRYLQAGINPLWAMKGGDPGNAQQLTSGQAAPAEVPSLTVPQMMPEADPTKLTNIVAASQGLSNSIQGFQQLALEALDTKSNIDLRKSQQALNVAEAAFKSSQRVGQELQNNWSAGTLDIRLRSAAVDLDRQYKELDKLSAETEQYRAKSAEIRATTDLIGEQINQVVEGIKQRDRELALLARNVLVNERNATVNEYNAETGRGNLMLQDEKFSMEIRQWNNENLLKFLDRFSTSTKHEGDFKFQVAGFGPAYHQEGESINYADVLKARSVGIELLQRAASNPSPQNLHDAERASGFIRITDDIIRSALEPVYSPAFTSSNSSVLNPSAPWQ